MTYQVQTVGGASIVSIRFGEMCMSNCENYFIGKVVVFLLTGGSGMGALHWTLPIISVGGVGRLTSTQSHRRSNWW